MAVIIPRLECLGGEITCKINMFRFVIFPDAEEEFVPCADK
jgi:hypothetical protein